MARSEEKSLERRVWQLPSPAASTTALTYFHNRDRTPVKLTLKCKLHKPGAWKTRKLLNTHLYVTNLKSQILQAWVEDPHTKRTDGALGEIQKARETALARMAQTLSIEDQDDQVANVQSDTEQEPGKLRYLDRNFGEVIRTRFSQLPDDPFPGRLHESVCRASAQVILSWRQKLAKNAASVLGKKQHDITLDDLYQVWQAQVEAYEQAAAMPIPFGRNKDQPLEEYGKREARWLLQRMLPEDEITKLLETVETLLDDEARIIDGQVHVAPLPWRRAPRHQRAVRESRLLQRVLDPAGDLVLLGSLHKDELATLRKELLEMRAYAASVQNELQHLQAALAEVQEVNMAFEDFRALLETFLYKKPEPYPTVEPVQLSSEHHAMLEETYNTWLKWFLIDPNRPRDAGRFLNLEEEIRHRNGMQQAAKALKPPKLQPIPFIGTMRPGQWRDFALLYDKQTYEYVLAVILYRRDAVDADDQQYRQQQMHQRRQEEQQRYRERRQQHPLFYVNFPETPFTPPDNVAVMLFPLEYGFDHHDKSFLRKTIEAQRTAQQEAWSVLQAAGGTKSLAECLPAATIKTAKLICEWDRKGKPVFYVHVSVEPPLPSRQPQPVHVLGLSEHDAGYSFAVLELGGAIARDGDRQLIGDLVIPNHVDPARGAKPNTENYIYEVANAIVSLARRYNAFIGIEDTTWKKRRPELARERNHQVFRRASGRIATTVEYKAPLAGLLQAYIIEGVSPVRDCGICRSGLKSGTQRKTTFYEWRVRCPTCAAEQPLDETVHKQSCTSCNTTWQPDEHDAQWERMFACPICNAPAYLARQNTAIVVAQRTLVAIDKHHVNARAADMRRERKRSSQASGSSGARRT